MNNTPDKNQWHPAFCSAMQLELINADFLTYLTEYNLTKKPLEMDLLIISKNSDKKIENPIGHIFKKYNIVEYKSPDDKLNIDVFYKTIGYACLYKVSGRTVNEYDPDDITITIVRYNMPEKLFKELRKRGFTIKEKCPGIYYVEGGLFDTQIIVTKLLDQKDHIWLTILTKELSKEAFETLLEQAERVHGKGNEECTDSVLKVVFNTNKDRIKAWKEGDDMRYPSLAIIMQPELQQSRMEGILEGRREGAYKNARQVYKNMIERGYSEEEARAVSGIENNDN